MMHYLFTDQQLEYISAVIVSAMLLAVVLFIGWALGELVKSFR